MDIAFAILAPAALMLAAHWFPWRRGIEPELVEYGRRMVAEIRRNGQWVKGNMDVQHGN